MDIRIFFCLVLIVIVSIIINSCAPSTKLVTPVEVIREPIIQGEVFWVDGPQQTYQVTRFIDVDHNNICYIVYARGISCVPMKGQ